MTKLQIAGRLFKEFWIPTVAASFWTFYSVSQLTDDWSLYSVITIFGPSFFLISWASAQVFRVIKQTSVEENFTSIEQRLVSLVSSIETQTKDLIGYSTGGDSFVFFRISHPINTNIVCFDLLNESEYPVFDIHAELIDLNEEVDPRAGVFWTRHQKNISSLYPNKIIPSVYNFDMSELEQLRVNIFIQSRSIYIIQQFCAAKVKDNTFLYAHNTTCNDNIVIEEIPSDFPGYDDSDPRAVFK